MKLKLIHPKTTSDCRCYLALLWHGGMYMKLGVSYLLWNVPCGLIRAGQIRTEYYIGGINSILTNSSYNAMYYKMYNTVGSRKN